jgi:hypothetical protein
MKVDRDGSEWTVTDDEGVVRGRFDSSTAAWRHADRLEGDVVSAAEKRSDYGFRQSALLTNMSFVRKQVPIEGDT